MNDFDEVDAFSSYARKIRAISDITARWAGHYVQTVVCQMDTDWPEGDLALGFVEEGTPYTPVWLHLAPIRYLRMEDLRETGPCFIDGVHVSLLPARRSDWPAEARMHTLRSWEGMRVSAAAVVDGNAGRLRKHPRSDCPFIIRPGDHRS
ncbi:hypothetical protein ACWDE0_24700 [Streptomyces sp. 900105755]